MTSTKRGPGELGPPVAEPATPEAIEHVLVTERELWEDGPPHELFARLRSECPVHWTERFNEFPEEAGFWSVTTAERRPCGQPRLADLLLRTRRHHRRRGRLPARADAQAMFIGMDPPKHDRLKALFQAGFTPKRIADHEDAIRAIVIAVLDRLEGRESLRSGDRCRAAGRLAGDRQLHGHPRGGRRDVGAADELDARGERPGSQSARHRGRDRDATSPRSSSAAGD